MPAWASLWLLRLGVAVGLFVTGYVVAWTRYENKAEVTALKLQVKQMQTNIAVLEQDSTTAASDSRNMAALDKKIEELRNALADKDRTCFSVDDADRLRDLWDDPASQSSK